VCESVLAWAASRPGTSWSSIAPSERVMKRGPNTLEPTVHPKFVEAEEFVAAERYVAVLEDALLEVPVTAGGPPRSAGKSVFACPRVVTPDGLVAIESTQGQVKRCLPQPPEAAAPMAGDYFSLLSPYAWTGNYYHWTHDVLLSLVGVTPSLPPDTRFVVPPGLGRAHYESLSMLGISSEQTVVFEFVDGGAPHPAWRVERLHFSPGPIGPSASPEALAGLRRTALAHFGLTPAPPARRIYVTRGAARHRRVVNEDEVIRLVTGLSFEVHALEDLTLGEQIALFAEADTVVGPHGAGHINTIYAPPGLVLVDILGSEVNKCFHNVSLALGNDYWYLMGDDVPSGSRYTDDIHVPIEKLERTLARALMPSTTIDESAP